MTNEGDHPTAIIGRGESVITKGTAEEAEYLQRHPSAAAATDAEAADGEDNIKNEEAEIEGIKESQGWLLPKVKLSAWDPENEKQWEATGKYIAKRNLLASIPNLTCGFGVWLVWSGEYYICLMSDSNCTCAIMPIAN